MRTRLKLACLLIAGCIAPASHGKTLVFLDPDAWAAAQPGAEFQPIDFDGPRHDFAADSRNPLGGITVELLGGAGDPGPTGPDGRGFLRGELDNSGADALSLAFTFPATRGIALQGLQNDSLASPDRLDLAEIAFAFGDEQWILSDLLDASRGLAPFLGFVADRPSASLSIFHAGAISDITRSSENFYLDGLLLADTATVPEPAALALLATGLPALLVLVRRRPSRQRRTAGITR